jgi:hypothetical protein
LLFRASQRKEYRPKENYADGRDYFVIVRRLIEPAAKLLNAKLDALGLRCDLIAVVALILQR